MLKNLNIKILTIFILPFIVYLVLKIMLKYEDFSMLFLMWYIGYIMLIFGRDLKIKPYNVVGTILYLSFITLWIIVSLITQQNLVCGFFGEYINYWIFLTAWITIGYYIAWREEMINNERKNLRYATLFSIVYLIFLILFDINNIYAFLFGALILMLILVFKRGYNG
ncbi:conserved hypothetical protein [Methanocaldococcus sp. FS406-22]|uniref:hypothetical protein n=1 Tax=Methanocaldococcus sp. (strain FS406-22) TaxID=644281 RepID=UPI0001BF432E|nr:hypothetical protein [Methanocaldococcus sp. FS406-22]ADC70311.1 conserved hypothetical protein [Methanocaldococcus sp. FS406-22]